MRAATGLLCRVLLAATCLAARMGMAADDPAYDHQTATYNADLKPADPPGALSSTVTPYFSPDHSAAMVVSLIESASATVDIEIPSFASWSGCTPFADAPSCTPGCSAAAQRDESFPVFPALLNAMRHRGVKVRIVTNDYGTPDCPGTLTPLSYLALNGAVVRWYNQVRAQGSSLLR